MMPRRYKSRQAKASARLAILLTLCSLLAALAAACTDMFGDYSRAIVDMVSVQGGVLHNGVADISISDFQMGAYEITQAQYRNVMWTNPASQRGEGDKFPVYNLNWFNCLEFCNRLSIREGLTPVYSIEGSTDPDDWGDTPKNSYGTWSSALMDMDANGYRLPTEAEWQYAACGGILGTGHIYAGSDTTQDVAWLTDNSGDSAHQVGTKAPNELGLYDMTGNVYEWCWDWSADYPSVPLSDYAGPDNGTARVFRGGSFYYTNQYAGTAYRQSNPPYMTAFTFGFRIVRRLVASATSLSIIEDQMSLGIGQSSRIGLSIQPENADAKALVWTSDNESVAIVGQGGLIVGLAEGSATIKVSSQDGSLSDSCVVQVGSNVVSGVARDGLVGEWLFGGNAKDTSGNALNGVVTGAKLTKDRFGNQGSAYYFGGGASVDISNIPMDNSGGASVSYWINPTLLLGDIGYIDPSDAHALRLGIRNGSIFLNAYAHVDESVSYAVQAGTWYHLCLIVGTDYWSLYVNGQRIYTKVITDSVSFSDISRFCIGCDWDKSLDRLNFVTGSLDDVRLYRRALSESEVIALYADTSSSASQGD